MWSEESYLLKERPAYDAPEKPREVAIFRVEELLRICIAGGMGLSIICRRS